MINARANKLLDFIPLLILGVYASVLLWTVATTNIILQSEHYCGLVFLIITIILFFVKHQLGVIALGVTMLLGLFKILSFTAIISYYSIGGSLNDHSSPELKIQYSFILWLALHLILSKRYYFGILKKQYWLDLIKQAKSN